jgi:hypothetical protein
LKEAVRLQRDLIADLKAGRDSNAENPTIADLVKRRIDQKQEIRARDAQALPRLVAVADQAAARGPAA